jgi:hypothetical protein
MRTQPNGRRTDTLDYLQGMLGELRTMAQAERCDMLAYLIEMAYLEAGDIIRGVSPARSAKQSRPSAVPAGRRDRVPEES